MRQCNQSLRSRNCTNEISIERVPQRGSKRIGKIGPGRYDVRGPTAFIESLS